LFYAFGEAWGIKNTRSQEVINGLIGNSKLFLSTQVMQELHVNLVKKAGVDISRSQAVIKALAKNNVIVNDVSIVYEAIDIQRDHQISFWDSMIVAAAASAKCRYLLSEDLNSGQRISGVQILNPYL